MRVFLVVVIVGSFAAAQESSPTSRRAPESRSAPVGVDIGASVRDLIDAGEELLYIVTGKAARARAEMDLVDQGMKARKAGRTDDARQIYERLRHPPWPGVLGTILTMSLLVEEGDLDGAANVADEFAARPHRDETDASRAWSLVGSISERRGDWMKALDAWERQKPPAGWSGTFSRNDRLLHIAQCRFKLGDIDAALALLEGCLKDAAVSIPYHPGTVRSFADEVSAAYAEYAGRADQLVRARALIANLEEPAASKCRSAMRIVEGWLVKSPEAVVRAVGSSTVEPHIELGGRLLGEMDRAVEVLAGHIQTGDATAIELAIWSGRVELIHALEKRRAVGAADEETIGDAIERLRYRTKMQATSQPASRRIR